MGLRTTVAVAAVILVAAASETLAVDLLPHRAAYRMSLTEARQASGIVAARGSMIYTFGRTCDGWTVENNTRLRLVYEGGRSSDTAWTFVSWESDDGRDFRFRAHFSEDGRHVERISGRAKRPGDTGSGTAWLTEPRQMEIALPPGTMFPTEHIAAMISAAQRGETSLAGHVFDGASVDNPYYVHAFFGRLRDRQAAAVSTVTLMPSPPVWWSRLAFFPRDSSNELPEFELGASYGMDGVADRITQHFDDFTLAVRLDGLEKLPEPDC